MALVLVQRGTGTPRPLVAAFGPMTAGQLPKTLGPVPCIVADTDPKGQGTETIADVVSFAAQAAGVAHFSGTALIGFSIGCKRVKHLRVGGANAGAYLLLDGTHAPWPPKPEHIAWLKDLVGQARENRILLVASHTFQTYTEKIPQNPFASTVTVLRLATGLPLSSGGPPAAPIVAHEPGTSPLTSGLWVYSYASAEADAKAHTFQGGTGAHQLAGRHLAPWLASLGAGPTPQGRTLLVGDSLAAGLAGPLRARVRAAGGELAAESANGTTIDHWAHGSRLSGGLAAATPATTFVSLGTNDLTTTPADYKRPLIAAIVGRIRESGSRAAWILPPSMPLQDRGGVRAILSSELGRLGVPAFDSTRLDLPRGPDGIHPTPAGFDLWAQRIMEWATTPTITPSSGSTWPTGPTSPPWGGAGGSGLPATSDEGGSAGGNGLPVVAILALLAKAAE